jgi:hypothetical protein
VAELVPSIVVSNNSAFLGTNYWLDAISWILLANYIVDTSLSKVLYFAMLVTSSLHDQFMRLRRKRRYILRLWSYYVLYELSSLQQLIPVGKPALESVLLAIQRLPSRLQW